MNADPQPQRLDDDAHVKSNYVDCRLWLKEAPPRLTPAPAADPVVDDAHVKATYVECRLWLEPRAVRLAPVPATAALEAR